MKLSTADLKTYLWYVCKLKQDLFILKNTYNKIKGEISELNHTYYVAAPKKKEIYYPVSTFFKYMGLTIIASIAIFLVVWFFGSIIGIILSLIDLDDEIANLIIGIPIFILICGTIYSLIYAICLAKANSDNEKKYAKDYADYKDKYNYYNRKKNSERKRLEDEKQRIVALYNKQSALLTKLYNMNVIHEDYCKDWVAIASFYTYIDREICKTLEGHEGAYNKYDVESKLNLIITNLDLIIKYLEEIKSNQYFIKDLITQGYSSTKKLVNQSIDYSRQISDLSASNLYYSYISARNSSINTFLNLYNCLK